MGSALGGAWPSRRRPTSRGSPRRASSTKSCVTTSRRFGSRRRTSATARACPASWSRSFATSCGADHSAGASHDSDARGVGSIGSCRFPVREGHFARAVAGGAWRSAPPRWRRHAGRVGGGRASLSRARGRVGAGAGSARSAARGPRSPQPLGLTLIGLPRTARWPGDPASSSRRP